MTFKSECPQLSQERVVLKLLSCQHIGTTADFQCGSNSPNRFKYDKIDETSVCLISNSGLFIQTFPNQKFCGHSQLKVFG